MKQMVVALIIAGVAPLAFAQLSDKDNKPRVREHAQERPQMREHAQVQERPQVRERTNVDVRANVREGRADAREDRHEERAENRGGKLFFRDREIHRHPGFSAEDEHFRIGSHPREWYITRYSTIVMIDGCWYYEDGGMFWPAYGFDPGCRYPDEHIVFEF